MWYLSARSPPRGWDLFVTHKLSTYTRDHPSTKHVRALISAELDHATTYTQVGGQEGNSCQRTSVFTWIVVPMESRIHACMKSSDVQTGRFFGINVLRIEDERLNALKERTKI